MTTRKPENETGDADEFLSRESGYGASSDILIVDDVHANVFLLENLLADTYRVESVNKADAMWKYLKNTKPGLILLDLMMPDESGFDILQKMQADENLRTIPVIVVTARDSKSDVMKCLKLGAKDYIVKPVDENTLLKKIRNILGPK